MNRRFRELGSDEVVRSGHMLKFGDGATRIFDESKWMGRTVADIRKAEAEQAKTDGYAAVDVVILEKVE